MKRGLSFADFNRRWFLALTAGSAAAAFVGLPSKPGHAQSGDVLTLDEAIAKAVGDKTVEDAGGLVNLDLPQIAENGNTVPLGVSVDSPMTAEDRVMAVHIFADGNPRPEVISFHFSAQSGLANASTRMRLAKTQNVIALAELSDGRVLRAQSEVKVTIGGCGG
jgi:sulfur-oxidizing protein SoxY